MRQCINKLCHATLITSEIISNIKKKKNESQFEKQFNQNVILKMKRDLKRQKAKAVEYIRECFGDMLDVR